MKIWREDYTAESNLTGVPFFSICIRPETKPEAESLQALFAGEHETMKEIRKLIRERTVLTNVILQENKAK